MAALLPRDWSRRRTPCDSVGSRGACHVHAATVLAGGQSRSRLRASRSPRRGASPRAELTDEVRRRGALGMGVLRENLHGTAMWCAFAPWAFLDTTQGARRAQMTATESRRDHWCLYRWLLLFQALACRVNLAEPLGALSQSLSALPLIRASPGSRRSVRFSTRKRLSSAHHRISAARMPRRCRPHGTCSKWPHVPRPLSRRARVPETFCSHAVLPIATHGGETSLEGEREKGRKSEKKLFMAASACKLASGQVSGTLKRAS